MAQVDNISPGRRSATAASTVPTAMFVRGGEYWTVGFSGSTFSLRDVKGLNYLQRLLQHPGQEFHALDLIGGVAAQANPDATNGVRGSGLLDSGDGGGGPSDVEETDVADAAGSNIGPLLQNLAVNVGRPGDAGEMLDHQAKQAYRRKYLELKQELEDLLERQDIGRADRVENVKSEIDFLARELKRGLGLRGRIRRVGSASERARISIKHAITAALERISEHDGVLGEILGNSIKTGSFCSYSPSAREPVSWQFVIESREAPNPPEILAPPMVGPESGFMRMLEDQTTFVGRQAERAMLRRCLEQTLAGKPTVVMIGGAPGVGKTRIAREIAVEASQMGFWVLAGSCYDREDSIPFAPVVEVLESALAPDPQAFREAVGADAPEMARLIPQLRRMFPDIPPPREISPEQSRSILFSAVLELLIRRAGNRPMLLQLEDLHWADEGTLSLLSHVARSVSALPVMITGTYRDNELDPAGLLARTLDELMRFHILERITLGGLPRDATSEMIRALSGREPPEAVVSIIYSNTEGNPFFIEELFQHLVERGKLIDSTGEFRGSLDLDDTDVPQSLRLVIGRRLARLSDETQKILGTAAVIGRSFTLELLEASTAAEADWLLDHVEEAERAGLISSTLEHSEARFQFSHALIRQAVIANLSAPRHQRLHLRIAYAIERINADTIEDHAADLAHHLWQAGNAADAGRTCKYLGMAANRALAQSAYKGALQQLQNALELLKKLPESRERSELELNLQINLGTALLATTGWFAPEVGSAYIRARELCNGMGEDPRSFAVASGLWSFHLLRGEHPIGLSFTEEMLRLALRMADDGMLVQAQWSCGCSQFFMGDFSKAHASFAQGIRHYDRQRHRTLGFRFGQDPCMSSLCYDAMTLWMLGYPDQAEKRAAASLELARELGYPFTLVWCLAQLTLYHLIRQEFSRAEEMIPEGLALAREHGFGYEQLILTAYGAIGRTAQGKVDEETKRGESRRAYEAAGHELSFTWARSAYAEALAAFGEIDAAIPWLTGVAEMVERNQERFFESEVHRIKGELTLKKIARGDATDAEIQAAHSDAELSFRKAVEVARLRGAKMLEMRAALSLSRLLIRSNRRADARLILKETYAWFTEGFDSLELKAARSLMEELGAASEPDQKRLAPALSR